MRHKRLRSRSIFLDKHGQDAFYKQSEPEITAYMRALVVIR